MTSPFVFATFGAFALGFLLVAGMAWIISPVRRRSRDKSTTETDSAIKIDNFAGRGDQWWHVTDDDPWMNAPYVPGAFGRGRDVLQRRRISGAITALTEKGNYEGIRKLTKHEVIALTHAVFDACHVNERSS